jgi:hypothetical protein
MILFNPPKSNKYRLRRIKIMMYYLMIKEIEQTGMKYLCKRKVYDDPNDHIKYKGSGKLWNRILKAHPEYTLRTTVLGTYDNQDLKKYGLYYSNLYDVVNSSEWANLMPEAGDGGKTHSGTHPYINELTGKVVFRVQCPEGYVPYKKEKKEKVQVIHSTQTKKIRRIPADQHVPEGWEKGGLKNIYSYGPKKGTKVYNNGRTKIYLDDEDTIPEGFVPGFNHEGSTKNRVGCYNPLTLEKKYICSENDLPSGFVLGLPPTTGKPISTPYGIFNSVAECMKELNLTRHQVYVNIEKLEDWFYIKNTEDMI